MAMNSYRNYNNNTSALSSNLEKLSSGYKINRAGDDAAGLAISEKMRAQITGLDQAADNVKDGISLVKTAEGALQEVQDMLNRMVELATQSANGTYDDSVDRANLQSEVNALTSEIDRIAESSNFNGINLLDGSLGISSKGTGTLGTTEVKITLSGLDTGTGNGNNDGHQVINGTDTKITLKGVAGNDEGITVEFTDGTGAATISLGSKAAATYTADQITTAVRAAAADYASKGSTNAAAISKGYSTFTMDSGDISLKANDASTVEVAMVDEPGVGSGLELQIGDTSDDYNQMTVTIGNMGATSLGVGSIDISEQGNAQDAIDTIKTAINTVSSTRGDLGAIQNRLEHTSNNLSVMSENIQDAESTIRDTDIAEEMMAYTKNNILVQSAQAMLAQANQVPQGVLQLLQ
jgi:flagellin